MLPIVLDPSFCAVGLTGQGDSLARRGALLAGAGVSARILAPDADDAALSGLRVLFVAGLPNDAAAALAGRARALGILVNVEDVPEYCDFHVPAILRRGDLMLTVSTGGRVPGLSRRLREWLEERVGAEWEGRMNELGEARARWRAEGLEPSDVSQRTRDRIAERGWL